MNLFLKKLKHTYMNLKNISSKLLVLIFLILTIKGISQTFNKIPKQTFRYADMTAQATKTLYVKTNVAQATCNGPVPVVSRIRSAKLNVFFNWNSDYLAANTSTYSLTYTITAYTSYTGTSTSIKTYTVNSLTIAKAKPQAYTEIDFTSLHTAITRFDVKAQITTSGGTADPNVNANLYSDVYYTEDYEYSVVGTTLNCNAIDVFGSNMIKFSWVPTCQNNGVPPNYQFQLLRLYNNNPSLISDERNIRANINWDEALTLETGNSLTELTLTMAEGEGYYVWRVRPIGNSFEGGIANDRNWGTWTGTGAFTQGATQTISSAGISPYLFYFSYNEWGIYNPSSVFSTATYTNATIYDINNSDKNRNWIFNRNFVEGDVSSVGQINIGEGISYANKLQMATQKQVRLSSESKKIVSQSIYDYSGRAALNVLPTPVSNKYLQYEPKFIAKFDGTNYSAYSANDFDRSFNTLGGSPWALANNYKDPLPMDSISTSNGLGTPSMYYSSNNSIEDYVPTAAGYPFTRTLFSKDGKNTPIETSMPGKEHKINSTSTKRTTRVMESGVADVELVRVFGDEAPGENSVYKSITIDPNNTASVAYISKEGKTIATCISSPGATNLDPLPSASLGAFSVVSDINSNNSPNGTYSFRSFKTLALTENTNVTLNYNITPNTYSDEECYPSVCQTCDYKITLKVTENNEEVAPVVMTFTLVPPAAACSPTAITTNTTINLAPGEYTIERIIESNTAPSGSSSTYMNTFIQTAVQTLENDLLTGTATIVDDNGTPISGAPSINMVTFFTNLNNKDLTALYTQLGVVSTDTHINLAIGCNIIRVPIWHCETHDCSSTDMDFEAYLFEQLGVTPSSTVLNSIFTGYNLTQINSVIKSMFDSGYNCESLWNCWKGTVALYIANNNPGVTSSAGATISLPGGGTYTAGGINYLHNFLTCTGYEPMLIASSAGTAWGLPDTDPGAGYKTHPFKYFKYDAGNQCCSCESAMIASYTLCAVTPSHTLPTVCGSVSTFTAWFNAVNTIASPCSSAVNSYSGTPSSTVLTSPISNNKNDFFECVLNNTSTSGSPSACTSIVPTSTAAIAAASAADVIDLCKEHCEDLFDNFVTQYVDLYHSSGTYIQGDTYTLTPVDGIYYVGTTTLTSIPSPSVTLNDIYCRANLVVNACKNTCTVTVQANGSLGSPTEIANLQKLISGQILVASPTSGTNCPEGYISTTPTSNQGEHLIRILNNKLISVRNSANNSGEWWNYQAFLNSINSGWGSTYFNSSSPYVFVHPDVPSFFTLNSGLTNIFYVFNKKITLDVSNSAVDIYSLPSGVVPASSNFIYSSNTTSVVSSVIGLSNPAYIFTSSSPSPSLADFYPVASAPTGTFISVQDALASGVFASLTETTILNTYNNTSSEKGYWAYNLTNTASRPFIEIELNCNPTICYKIQTTPTVAITSTMVVDDSPTSCEEQTCRDLTSSIHSQISSLLQDYSVKIRNIYKKNCIDNLVDTYTATYSLKYHHYTLYYYDRAGNLVKTVPPAGVTFTSTSRAAHHPAHEMITEYEYNSLGQLVRQYTPDGGQTSFYYDAKGKLRFSQNAKQLLANKYSYTKYDELSRIVEVGEYTNATSPVSNINVLTFPTTNINQITRTVYSVPATGINYFGGKPQRYLQNRVSYSFTDVDGDATNTLGDKVITYYSYDPHGNVEWLIQDVPELGRNYIAYEYDLISGSVIKVRYNEEFSDKFFHRYTYDIDKRIKKVETSVDGIYWENDATYSYYMHGPLKRTLIGQDKIQGLDYVYTIQGWLKAFNGSNTTADPGGDGSITDNNMYVAKDAYSMVLGYYDNDYKNKTSLLNSNNGYNLSGINLFNGNISSWSSNFDKDAIDPAILSQIIYNSGPVARAFKYDELNRITSADYKVQNTTTFTWTPVNDFKETFSYDANGNIINLFRNGKVPRLQMDNLSYKYYTVSGSIYTPNSITSTSTVGVTNRLAYVDDAVSSVYTDDVDDQSILNYTYDEIGNLTSDAGEGITSIKWNVYGKISSIEKTVAAVTTTISFLYDASGNRVYKKVQKSNNAVLGDATTYYVKDASGNSMAVYERSNTGTSPNYTATYTLKEQPIFGSDRLGIRKNAISRAINYLSPATPTVQLTPTLVHTSSYPYIMLPLANNTQKQVYSVDINTIPSSITLGANEYAQTVLGIPTNSNVLYKHSRTQAMAYDMAGEVSLSVFTYSVFNGSPSVYTSKTTVLYTKDKTLTTLTGLNNSPESQAAFLKKPGANDQYYLFTIGTDGKPYYHTIDATMGTIVDMNNSIDSNTDYGNTMALYEDRTGQGNSALYLQRYNSSTSTSSVVVFSISETGIQMGANVSLGTAVSSSKEGEICISPSGSLIAVATNSTASLGKISLFTLSSNHQTLTASTSRTITGTTKSLEFSNTDNYLYYTSYSGTTCNLNKVTTSLTTPTVVITRATTSTIGSIRKGVNNNLYYVTNTTGATTATLNMIVNPHLSSNTVSTYNFSVSISNGSMPIQPHLLAYSTPATNVVAYSRELDKKEYEMKDHLGNVHATFKDYKVPFVSGTSDIVYQDNFESGTTGGFSLLSGSPAGSSVTCVNNSLRVLSNGAGAAAQKNISISVSPGQYLLSFDYIPGTCSAVQFNVANITNGAVTGGISLSGRNDYMINVPSSTSILDLRFVSLDAATNKFFYIDNLLIKKLDEPNTKFISTIVDENYSTASNWIGTSTTIDYSLGTLKVTKDPLVATGPYYVTKSLMLVQDQLYKLTFKAAGLSLGTSTLSIAFENDDFSTQWLDYDAPLSSSALTTYTYYLIPKTNKVNFIFNVKNSAGTFNFEIDDFKVEHLSNPINPLYSSVLNNMTDYYSFGSPMPGRKFTSSSSYKYGFNGMEKDDEISGEGNSYTTHYRCLDVRLGRWMSIDPKSNSYESPYASMGNSPILYSDPMGDIIHASLKTWVHLIKLALKDKDIRARLIEQWYDTRQIDVEGKKTGNVKTYNQKQIYHYNYNKSSEYTLDDAISKNEDIRKNIVDGGKDDRTLQSKYYKGISFSDGEGDNGNIVGAGGAIPITKNTTKYSDKKYTEGVISFIGGSNDDTGEDHLRISIKGKIIVDMDLPVDGTFKSGDIPFSSDVKGKVKIEIFNKEKGKPGAFGVKYDIKSTTKK